MEFSAFDAIRYENILLRAKCIPAYWINFLPYIAMLLHMHFKQLKDASKTHQILMQRQHFY
jgi:hypothetical protein